jgi:hypothetical protein
LNFLKLRLDDWGTSFGLNEQIILIFAGRVTLNRVVVQDGGKQTSGQERNGESQTETDAWLEMRWVTKA